MESDCRWRPAQIRNPAWLCCVLHLVLWHGPAADCQQTPAARPPDNKPTVLRTYEAAIDGLRAKARLNLVCHVPDAWCRRSPAAFDPAATLTEEAVERFCSALGLERKTFGQVVALRHARRFSIDNGVPAWIVEALQTGRLTAGDGLRMASTPLTAGQWRTLERGLPQAAQTLRDLRERPALTRLWCLLTEGQREQAQSPQGLLVTQEDRDTALSALLAAVAEEQGVDPAKAAEVSTITAEPSVPNADGLGSLLVKLLTGEGAALTDGECPRFAEDEALPGPPAGKPASIAAVTLLGQGNPFTDGATVTAHSTRVSVGELLAQVRAWPPHRAAPGAVARVAKAGCWTTLRTTPELGGKWVTIHVDNSPFGDMREALAWCLGAEWRSSLALQLVMSAQEALDEARYAQKHGWTADPIPLPEGSRPFDHKWLPYRRFVAEIVQCVPPSVLGRTLQQDYHMLWFMARAGGGAQTQRRPTDDPKQAAAILQRVKIPFSELPLAARVAFLAYVDDVTNRRSATQPDAMPLDVDWSRPEELAVEIRAPMRGERTRSVQVCVIARGKQGQTLGF